jgi:hypothetical protein
MPPAAAIDRAVPGDRVGLSPMPPLPLCFICMDPLMHRPELFAPSVLPGAQTELRWQDSELWTVRRPYPIVSRLRGTGALHVLRATALP